MIVLNGGPYDEKFQPGSQVQITDSYLGEYGQIGRIIEVIEGDFPYLVEFDDMDFFPEVFKASEMEVVK